MKNPPINRDCEATEIAERCDSCGAPFPPDDAPRVPGETYLCGPCKRTLADVFASANETEAEK